MDTRSVVAAFAESPALRETLAVLLEHECRLEFLSSIQWGPTAGLPPDLAIVAARAPNPLLGDLAQRWPRLPIIAINLSGGGREPGGPQPAPPAPGIPLVPLEPRAIRDAVLRRLPARPDRALSIAAHAVGDALRYDLSYAFTALRSVSTSAATNADADTYPLLGAIMRKQAEVLREHLGDLDRFLARPHAVESSREFLRELRSQFERNADAVRSPALLWDGRVEPAAPAASGPITLAPIVSSFVWAYVRRCCDASVLSARITASTMTFTYPRASSLGEPAAAWRLLLAQLTLQPWAWQLCTETSNGRETLSIAPAPQAGFRPNSRP